MGCCQTISQEKAEFDMFLSTSNCKKTKSTQEQESEGDESFNDISLDSSSYDRFHGTHDFKCQDSFTSSLNGSQEAFLASRQERSLTNSFNIETAMSCASSKALDDLYAQTDSRGGTNLRHFTAPYRISRMSVYKKSHPADTDFAAQALHFANRLEEIRVNLNTQRLGNELITDSQLSSSVKDLRGSNHSATFRHRLECECIEEENGRI
jgi:hypothetical protein